MVFLRKIKNAYYNQQMDNDFIIKKEPFLRMRDQPFQSVYITHPKLIGEGSFAKVYRAREKKNEKGPWRAVKIYSKKNMGNREQMLNELNILKKLDHPSIIKIFQVFQNELKIYVVEDYCQGGELFTKLADHGGFSQQETKKIFKQLVEGINYCHLQKICHRDIKLENILFLKKDSFSLKIIDFGLAFEWEQSMPAELLSKSSKNVIGTSYYISPDILNNNNNYDQRTDIWSLGVVLYTLVTGIPPFDGETQQEIFQKIVKYDYTLNIPEMKHASPQLKDLIKKILVPVEQRLTMEQINKHTWMVNEPNSIPVKINIKNLSTFTKFSKTKKLAANFLVSQMSSIELENLTKLFHQMDLNKDGEISYEELKKGLQKQGMKVADIKLLMDSLDVDHSGKINYTQFLAGFSGEALFDDESMKRVFNMLDRDGNGMVEKSQLVSLLSQSGMKSYQGRQVHVIVDECDKDGNGMIDFNQFKMCLIKKS